MPLKKSWCWFPSVVLAIGTSGCLAVESMALIPVRLVARASADSVPTIELPESQKLLDGVTGSMVVATHSRRLSVVSLPTCRVQRYTTTGVAIAASAIDSCGRVAYLRETLPLKRQLFGMGDPQRTIVLKHLRDGAEHPLAELVPPRGNGACKLDIRDGRVLFVDGHPQPIVVDIETGAMLDTTWWLNDWRALGFSPNSRAVLAIDTTSAGPEARLVNVDIASRAVMPAPEHLELASGAIVDAKRFIDGYERDRARMAGLVDQQWEYLTPSVTVYAGVPGPESGARTLFGLSGPEFERSIRLCDLTSAQTVTILQRFSGGSFRVSSFQPPQ